MSYYEDNRDDLLHYQKLYNNVYHEEYKQYQKEYYQRRKSDPKRYKQMVDVIYRHAAKKSAEKKILRQNKKLKKLKELVLKQILRNVALISDDSDSITPEPSFRYTIKPEPEPVKIIDDAFVGYKMTHKGNYYLEW